jgi:hypothetical protein
MPPRAPTPVCKALVVCRQIFMDDARQDLVLVAPIHQVFLRHFPADEDLSVFARWTNAHGRYRVELQMRELDGTVLWRDEMPNPFEVPDPLVVVPITLRHRTFHFPQPGKYEVALLANGEEVAADIFWAHAVAPRNP